MKKDLDIIYNKKYLVIVPTMSKNLLPSFEYTFGNTIVMENTLDDIDFFIEYINKNNFEQLIFIDYQLEYEQVLEKLTGFHKIKFIFTKSLASLSDQFFYQVFKSIYKLYQKEEIEEIGLLDKSLYTVLANKKDKVKHIMLNIEKESIKNSKNTNTIGLLNNEEDPKHSFYNELSAIKLAKMYKAKLTSPSKVNKEFLKIFNIDYCIAKKEDVSKNNIINLYVNFTNNNDLVFLESMDQNIPCILGNTELLDNYPKLKSKLVMKSDDDINEIADRIKLVEQNKDSIIKEYTKFRKEYDKKSIASVEAFTNTKKETKTEQENDILLSVIIPVYNTEAYLKKCLESVINARIENMEILIINDGSKDNSEKVALKFQKEYPNMIRYIKQENHGLGNVRNVGLKEAQGKYIASIDSDDTININFFTDAQKYMKDNVDIILYDWLTVTEKEKYQTAAIDYVYANHNRYEGILYTTIMPSQCNKILKRSLYQELDITYIEDKYEDLSTNPLVLLKAETIKYINKPYYEYYIRSNSIMRSTPGYSMIDVIKAVDKRLDKYQNYCNVNINKMKFNTFFWRIEEYIINPLYELEEEKLDNMVQYIYKNIEELYLKLLSSEECKEMLGNLKNQTLKSNIEKRNKEIQNKKLKQFIIKNKKRAPEYKLTPPMIVYGE